METKDFRIRAIEWLCWAFFGMCAICIGRWSVLQFVCWAGWEKPDWAAWVQAAGACVGIAIAIYVPARQHYLQTQREEARERADIAATLSSVRSELLAHRSTLEDAAGAALRKIRLSQPFRVEIRIGDKPFTIYNAIAPKLGNVPNDELRNAIIKAYSAAGSFIQAIRWNNELIDKDAYASGIGEKSNFAHEQLVESLAAKALADHSAVVSMSYSRMNRLIDDVLSQIA